MPDMTCFLLQISGTALVLDEIINHVQTLQRQVEVGLFTQQAFYMNLFVQSSGYTCLLFSIHFSINHAL